MDRGGLEILEKYILTVALFLVQTFCLEIMVMKFLFFFILPHPPSPNQKFDWQLMFCNLRSSQDLGNYSFFSDGTFKYLTEIQNTGMDL